jgi:hypothetical protein
MAPPPLTLSRPLVPARRLRAAAALTVLALLVAVAAGARASAIPAPHAVLGFEPGDDRRLADWATIVAYFTRLAASSDRVKVEEIGRSTLDRPLVLATISSPANLARLDRLREIQRRLADPRTIPSEAAARALIAEGKSVVLITCGIHSTEVGSTLSSTVIAHRLATDQSAETRRILDECIVLVVPSLNPDGVDIVKRWYDGSLGTPWEGTPPPELYHHYTGHDDNRDWYAFTQIETRAVVEHVHNRWHPHVVNDIHQQGAYGSRLFVPPYVEPFEPNVPPEIIAGVNAFGTSVAWTLTSSGKSGVVTNASYDAWTPARAYSHYHGGLRILTETASARIASPLEVKADQLNSGRGYNARVASANFPRPWQGGTWRLADIIDYMTSAAFAIMREASEGREQLLSSFYRIGRNAVTRAPGEPFAFLVPPEPELLPAAGSAASEAVRARARAVLLDTLARGGVELRIAASSFKAGSETYPAGTAIVPYDQPYGAFAKSLLELQRYPDRRECAGGPPEAPYDVTAHSLSLLTGFKVVRVDDAFAQPESRGYKIASASGAQTAVKLRIPSRVGLYRGATAPIDEGWTRWMFDQFDVGFRGLDERDVLAGGLRERFDTIVLPDMSARDISAGRMGGTAPPGITGGLGETGAAALVRFVEDGGTLVALNTSSRYAIDALGLPVRDALTGVSPSVFYCPGSILGLDVAPAAGPIAAGIARQTIGWFENGPGFDVPGDDPSVRVVARFAPIDRLLVSGWLLGGDRLAGKAALVEVSRGRGRVVLFAFRPQYRGQSLATLPFLFNAIQ